MSEGKKYRVITAVGPDRPGLVKAIASLVHEIGANLEDTRMAILGGEFALLMLVTGEDAAIARLDEQRSEIETQLGLKLILKETGGPRPGSYLLYRLKVTGIDRPGIVHQVSSILAERGVNVASLESRVAYAPLSGTPLFVLEAELQIPSRTAVSELRRQLGQLCEQENLDLLLESAS